MELYEIPSVFMDTKESLQRLKMRDKTRGCCADGRRIRQLWRGGESVNLYRQMTFMPLSGALDEEAAESASVTARVWKRLLFTVKRAGSQYASWLNQVGRLQLWKKFVCVCAWSGGGLFLFTNYDWIAEEQRPLRVQTREWIVFFLSDR